MKTEEQLEKLGRAADWRATLIILTDAFAGDQRVWQHWILIENGFTSERSWAARSRLARELC